MASKFWHRRFRRISRSAIGSKSIEELEDYILTIVNEIGNLWGMGKDGRHICNIDNFDNIKSYYRLVGK
jgi:hypothetical protein